MKNLRKKVSALAMATFFAASQMSAMAVIDTGLGAGNGGAVINGTQGGFVNMTTGTNSADLNFNGDSHVNWNTLNVNSGEALNFNAINGAKNITVLNTVNQGMSTLAGTITANSGISNLIISNPNGVLYSGGTFATAGDAMITTQPMTATFTDGVMSVAHTPTTAAVGMVTIQDSNMNVGGQFTILAPSIDVVRGSIKANSGLKLVTQNGQDYLATGNKNEDKTVRLETVNIDGNVYVLADKGIVKTSCGGEIKGNLTITSDDKVALNYYNEGKALHVTGDVNALGNGTYMYARNTKVDGNLTMTNGGGFLEVGNVQVGKNMTLKTPRVSENKEGYKHFVHVIGNSTVGGDATIESENNIHIGNYKYETMEMLDGSLTVGGNLKAHANDGHVAVTIDTTAKKIDLKSDKLNVLTDGKAVLTAEEYSFSSNGYIGGISDTKKLINSMEKYTYYPAETPSSVIIAGGKVTKIETGATGEARIASLGDMEVTGANAGDVYLTAYEKDIKITGDDVHANMITVGKETKKLKVEFPGRDYDLKYTNIRDNQEVVVHGNEVITYELTDAENGYNDGTQVVGENTYLVGPGKPVDPVDPDPVDPDPVTPDPVEPDPVIPDPVTPDPVTPNPVQPQINPDDTENVRVLDSYRNQAVDLNQVYTPVAYAADLDDDEKDIGVRKNVDGSVTVVRAYPMGK